MCDYGRDDARCSVDGRDMIAFVVFLTCPVLTLTMLPSSSMSLASFDLQSLAS